MSAPTTRSSKKSSENYAVEIPLSRSICRRLTIAWAIFGLLGLLLVLHSGQPPYLLAIIIAGWLAITAVEAAACRPAQIPYTRVLLRADGSAVGVQRRKTESLALVAGSLIVGQTAWLRFRSSQNRDFSVILRATDLGENGWRRLNLLWRHGLKG